jgi:hypothetical protein
MEIDGPFRCKDLAPGDSAADRFFIIGEELFNIPKGDSWTSQLATTIAFRAVRFTIRFAPAAVATSALAVSAPV